MGNSFVLDWGYPTGISPSASFYCPGTYFITLLKNIIVSVSPYMPKEK
jgi:hypothetical protein